MSNKIENYVCIVSGRGVCACACVLKLDIMARKTNSLRDWSLLIPWTGTEGNIIFSPKNS